MSSTCHPPHEISPRLSSALHWLQDRQQALSLPQIQQFHAATQLSLADLRAFVQFSDERYRRNLIYADDYCELLLLCWHSTQRSRIHNHRASCCGVRVLQGVATETLFGRTSHGQIYAQSSRELPAGSLVSNRHLDVHQISNLQPYGQDLITLHLYSPPLRQMELFSLESGSVAPVRHDTNWAFEI